MQLRTILAEEHGLKIYIHKNKTLGYKIKTFAVSECRYSSELNFKAVSLKFRNETQSHVLFVEYRVQCQRFFNKVPHEVSFETDSCCMGLCYRFALSHRESCRSWET